MKPEPMLLDSSAGCPGVRNTIRGTAPGICHACARWGEPGPQIEPEAKKSSGGEYFCPNRRSAGTGEEGAAVHAANVADEHAPGYPNSVGSDCKHSGGNGGVR